MAGGLYDTQPALRIGRLTSDQTEVQAGTGGLQFNTGGGVTCPGAGDPPSFSVRGFQLTPSAIGPVPGDSGGPVYLAYGGKWFLGGIASGGQANALANVSGIWWIPMAGWKVCTATDPC